MTNENINKLNALRSLPRGTQVDSRIAAIKELLGETEVFKTIQNLRWPEGIVCPRCHSQNIVRKDPPSTSSDQRGYYECLQCQGRGDSGEFDDLTGLPIQEAESHLLNHISNWILCWYLLAFCSLSKIAEVLGMSLMQVMEMAELGSHISEIPKEKKISLEFGFFSKTHKDKTRLEKEKKQSDVLQDELHTRSESKSPFKPGPKSQK